MRIKKKYLGYGIIVILILIIGTIVLINDDLEVSSETVKCIGDNSVLYIQTGCGACKVQEDMFGEYYEQLRVVDCVYNSQICQDAEIKATPTWVIDGEKYVGVQEIEELQKTTKCSV